MERRFFVISCGTRNKKVAYSDEMSHDLIKAMVKNKFEEQLSNDEFHIQYFDRDVDDWIDLEDGLIDDIKECQILKMKVVMHVSNVVKGDEECAPAQSSGRLEQACSITPSTVDQEPQKTPTSLNKDMIPSSANLTTPKRPGLKPIPPMALLSRATQEEPVIGTVEVPKIMSAVASPDVECVMQSPPVSLSKTTPTRKSWPRLFKIQKETIPRTVREKLESEQHLNTSERRLLLEAFYNDATQYDGGFYPTSRMYDDMVDCLMREYPYLLTIGGLPAKSAREFWKDKLVFKFGNTRKRLDKNHPEVQMRKKKEKAEKLMTSPTTPTTFTWGLANYLPRIPVTEDETSHDLHLQWLQREHRKTSPDVDLNTVDLKMNLTFARRRQMVVEEGAGILQLLEKYPWLQSYQETLKEFERLKPKTSSSNMEDLVSSGLEKYRKAVVGQLNGKKKPGFIAEMENTKINCRTENQRNYTDDCIALVGLPLLFKEKPEKLVTFKEEAESAIQIHVKDKILSMSEDAFGVKLDGCLIFECDNFFQAFCGCIASIYVFNLAYPKDLTKYFTFLQNILIGLKDNEGRLNLDKRILNVLTAINMDMN